MSLTSVDARLDGRRVAADLDRVLEQLAEAERVRVAAVADLAGLVGEVDGECLARWLGYVSLERLITHRSGWGGGQARSLVMVARHLDRFSATGEAVRSGRIGFAAAEVLARTARGLAGPYGRDEAGLLHAAEGSEPDELERMCRLWRAQANVDANTADAERVFNQRGVWMQLGFDGAGHGRFSLDPIGTEAVWAALETKPDPATHLPEPRTAAQRRADKLVDVCTASLETPPDATGSASATIDVVIDIETLAAHTGGSIGDNDRGRQSVAPGTIERMRSELAHGGPITGPGLERLLCDASFRALITDGPRTVLAYNRATPAIPPGLRRAVRIRDQHCTFTGCDRPWQWCDNHHIIPRSRGGPTTAENLTLLCRFHHTCVHEHGWALSRAPDGTITVRSP
jgi:hypothetical protein